MLGAILFNYSLWVPSWIEGSPKDLRELFIKATNTKRHKTYIFFEDLFDFVAHDFNQLGSVFLNAAINNRLLCDRTKSLTHSLLESFNSCNFYFKYKFSIAQGQRKNLSKINKFLLKCSYDCFFNLIGLKGDQTGLHRCIWRTEYQVDVALHSTKRIFFFNAFSYHLNRVNLANPHRIFLKSACSKLPKSNLIKRGKS